MLKLILKPKQKYINLKNKGILNKENQSYFINNLKVISVLFR